MPVVDPRIAGKPVPRISKETMERDNVARARTVKGSDLAFLDQRIPAYQREIIDMVGMGVTENAALKPNVKAPAHGFSITYVRAPKGKGAALHRHATEEVFIPVKGRWQVCWLEGEAERTVDLDEGDVCNVPIGIYRGFRNLSGGPEALLMAIIGGPRRRQGRLASLGGRGGAQDRPCGRRRGQSDHREAGGVNRGTYPHRSIVEPTRNLPTKARAGAAWSMSELR